MSGDAVYIGRMQVPVARTTESIVTMLVRHNPQDIGPLLRRQRQYRGCSERYEKFLLHEILQIDNRARHTSRESPQIHSSVPDTKFAQSIPRAVIGYLGSIVITRQMA